MTRNHQKGFTLIELLVVVSIITMLASIVYASLNGARIRAKQVKILHDVHEFKTALELYRGDNNTYPIGGFNSLDPTSWNSLGSTLSNYIRQIPQGISQAELFYNYMGPNLLFSPFMGSTCINTGDGFFVYTSGNLMPREGQTDGGWSADNYEIFGGSAVKC